MCGTSELLPALSFMNLDNIWSRQSTVKLFRYFVVSLCLQCNMWFLHTNRFVYINIYYWRIVTHSKYFLMLTWYFICKVDLESVNGRSSAWCVTSQSTDYICGSCGTLLCYVDTECHNSHKQVRIVWLVVAV